MERLTQTSDRGGVAFTFDLDITCEPSEIKKILKLAEKLKDYEDLGYTPEECRAAMDKQIVEKELESHDEKHILKYCISLMQELVGKFEEWYEYVHGEDAIRELDEVERFYYRCHILVSFKNCFFSEPVILEVHLREQNVNS